MIPYYISIIILLVGVIVFYAKFVRREELRHLAEERDAEKRHADEMHDILTVFVDGALSMRGLDTRDEAKMHAAMLHEDKDREPTLEELEAELAEAADPLTVSMDGELGRRRELALKIAHMRADRQMGLAEPQEEIVGDHINTLSEDDKARLDGRAN